MRVLFCSGSGFGHIQPMLPLARAFRDAGHTVAVATADDHRLAMVREGFAFLAAGLGAAAVDQAFAPVLRQASEMPIAERRPFVFAARMGEIEGPARLDDLRRAADAFQPDLVVHESADLAAPLVASERGLATVNHGFGRPVPVACLERGGAAMAPHWRAAGLTPDPLGGAHRGVLVDIWPDGLGFSPSPTVARVEHLRPVSVVATPRAPRSRPLVYVTLGTVFNEIPLFRTLLAGLADLDCDVLATVGADLDPAALGPTPVNARVERFVPQDEILPDCSLAVTHGGSGSTLGALAYGLPLLLVPRAADQFENAAACVEAGVGRSLLPPEVSPDAVAGAATALLSDPQPTARAAAVARTIASMPSPAEVVENLVRC